MTMLLTARPEVGQPSPQPSPINGRGSRIAASRFGRERRARHDSLPENAEYRDEGCDLFASCLGCPLPRCRYDEPGGARMMLNRVRDQEIRRLHYEAALSVDEIAMRYRVSRRTVFRVLRLQRPATLSSQERTGAGRIDEAGTYASMASRQPDR
jgi:hypothetical protein